MPAGILPLTWEKDPFPLVTKGWSPEISLAGQRHLLLVDANGKENFAQHGDLENSTVTNFSHRGELAKTDYY